MLNQIFVKFLAKFVLRTARDSVDLVGAAAEIPLTIAETKKARLEVEGLEEQKTERNRLIVSPTDDQIKEFSPLYQKIKRKLKKKREQEEGPGGDSVEYALVIIIIAVASTAAMKALANAINNLLLSHHP